MLKKLHLFICLLAIPILGETMLDNSHLPSAPFDRAVGSLQKDVINYINKRYQLICYAPLISAPTNVFLSYGFMANVIAPIEEPEARKLVVESADFLLQRVNQDPVLRKYMEKERFDFSDITVCFTFHNEQRDIIETPHLSSASKYRGSQTVIYEKLYFTRDPVESHTAKEWSEPFEEAREKIRLENTKPQDRLKQ